MKLVYIHLGKLPWDGVTYYPELKQKEIGVPVWRALKVKDRYFLLLEETHSFYFNRMFQKLQELAAKDIPCYEVTGEVDKEPNLMGTTSLLNPVAVKRVKLWRDPEVEKMPFIPADVLNSVCPDWLRFGYLRFGEVPDNERSRNHLCGYSEKGVSVYQGVCIKGKWYLMFHRPIARKWASAVSIEELITERECSLVDGVLMETDGFDDEPLLRCVSIQEDVKLFNCDGL